MLDKLWSSSISHLWVCCLGLLHESHDKSILAERAFLEAKKQLRAEEAKRQTLGEEERRDGEKNNKNEKDQQSDKETAKPARVPPTVNQGRRSRKKQNSVHLCVSLSLHRGQPSGGQWWSQLPFALTDLLHKLYIIKSKWRVEWVKRVKESGGLFVFVFKHLKIWILN